MACSLETLPSHALLARTRSLITRGNALEADLLAHLGEADARRLYLEEACSSMFEFCVRVLHFAEPVAYKRIQAARAARRHPELLAAVRRGELHLTAVGLLAPQLTRENCAELIREARHKKAEDIRRMLADRQPKPDVASCVSRVPAAASPACVAPARRDSPQRAARRRALRRALHRRTGPPRTARGAQGPDAAPDPGRRRGEDHREGHRAAARAGAQAAARGDREAAAREAQR